MDKHLEGKLVQIIRQVGTVFPERCPVGKINCCNAPVLASNNTAVGP